MGQILEKLFGSVPKARVLRVFTQNPERQFTFNELLRMTQIRSRTVASELKKLVKIGLVKRKVATVREEVRRKSRSQKKTAKTIFRIKQVKVYFANSNFELLPELQDLVAKASVASRKKLLDKIQRLGKVKLAVLAGIFLHNNNSRIDLLVVGDNIRGRKFEKFLQQVESELGKSLRYTLMDTREFKYRMDMYDKFLRDLLEYPHEKLINRLRI